jgi:hypothetical protein
VLSDSLSWYDTSSRNVAERTSANGRAPGGAAPRITTVETSTGGDVSAGPAAASANNRAKCSAAASAGSGEYVLESNAGPARPSKIAKAVAGAPHVVSGVHPQFAWTAGPVNRVPSRTTRASVAPLARRPAAASRARSPMPARPITDSGSPASGAKVGSPPATSVTTVRPSTTGPMTARVGSVASGPNVSRAVAAVSSFMFDAGAIPRVPSSANSSSPVITSRTEIPTAPVNSAGSAADAEPSGVEAGSAGVAGVAAALEAGAPRDGARLTVSGSARSVTAATAAIAAGSGTGAPGSRVRATGHAPPGSASTRDGTAKPAPCAVHTGPSGAWSEGTANTAAAHTAMTAVRRHRARRLLRRRARRLFPGERTAPVCRCPARLGGRRCRSGTQRGARQIPGNP